MMSVLEEMGSVLRPRFLVTSCAALGSLEDPHRLVFLCSEC